ncbi:MAG: zinc ABC transporter substrate-binding protein [Pseudomonadota bacterium]
MKKNNLLFFIGLVLLLQTVCLQAKPIAFVSILPQKFLVQSLAKDLLDVKVLVKPGQSPETFDPKPRQMAELSKATLYFTLGLSFERVIIKRIVANNKQLQVIDTQQGIEQFSHYNDPHTWLDPVLVKRQVETIYLALKKQFPDSSELLKQRHKDFQKQLDELNISLVKLFLYKGTTPKINTSNKNNFVIFHPALSHFARRYQLNQIAIEKEGKSSSAKYMANLMSRLKNQSVKYILVEKQFSKKEAQTVARSIQANLLEIDPLAQSWLENMYNIAEQVHKALF